MRAEESLDEKLMDIIIEERLDNALDDALQKDAGYQQSEQLKRQKCDRLKEIGLTEEQWEEVEVALMADNSYCAIYGELAYRQGFQDGVKNMREKPEGTIPDVISRQELNAILGDVLQKDTGYQQSDRLKRKKCNRLRKIKLTEEQWEKVEEALRVDNAYCAIYGEIAYQQGFQDGAKIMSELKRLV